VRRTSLCNNQVKGVNDVESALEMMFGEIRSLQNQMDEQSNLIKSLLDQRTIKEFYTTAEVAAQVGRSVFQVQEWCRKGRIRATHQPGTGRGNKPEWRIGHTELSRYQNEGLLPLQRV